MKSDYSNAEDQYDIFFRRLHNNAVQQRIPINGCFELTNRCNLSCKMCYIHQGQHNNPQLKNELTTKEWLRLADLAIENGMVFLLLTGGEIFLRKDFFDIYIPLTRKGIIITLFTNGTLLNDSIVAKLAENPPHRMEISLYGATEKTYESLTGIRGSYVKCCEGIEKILKHGIPLKVKSTITKDNIGEVEMMFAMAKNWGVPFNIGWLLSNPRDGIFNDVAKCRLTASEGVELEARISVEERYKFHEKSIDKSINITDKLIYCYAGTSAYSITAFGEMNACIDIPYPSVKPLEVGFLSAWEDVQRFVDEMPPLKEPCKGCDIDAYCMRCPARSFQATGSYSAPVPYLCEIAQLRKEKYA